jgi:sialate O-acetylesterase
MRNTSILVVIVFLLVFLLIAVTGVLEAGSPTIAPATDATSGLVVPYLFSDDMVLQRDRPVPIWGQASPGTLITVTFAEQTKIATADQQGNWEAILDPLTLDEKGGSLTIDAGSGGQKSFQDVVVGDVWLAGGQSNMQYALAEASTGADAIAKSDNPLLRVAIFPREQLSSPTPVAFRWQKAAPSVVSQFSAVAYFFGRDLQSNLKIPIGIIECDYGSTSAECWVSQDVMNQGWPDYQHYLTTTTPDYFAKIPQLVATRPFTTMLSRVAPYSIRGTIWYQAEGNFTRPTEYERLFPTQIALWRKIFRFADMPFLFVQLPRLQSELPKYPVGVDWSQIRQAQLKTWKNTPHTFMAVTIDLPLLHGTGPNDVPIHPSTKEPVGDRLALAARGMVYGQPIVYSGPVVREVKTVGEKAEIDFDFTGQGLSTLDGKPLRGLYGGPAQGPLQPLKDVSLQADNLTFDTVPGLQLVRYGFEADMGINLLDVNLGNSAGLPASPFVVDLTKRP